MGMIGSNRPEMAGRRVEHRLDKGQRMLSSVKPGTVSAEIGQHGVQRVHIDVVLGRLVGLSIAEVVAAGRDIYVVTGRRLNEVGGPECTVEILT